MLVLSPPVQTTETFPPVSSHYVAVQDANVKTLSFTLDQAWFWSKDWQVGESEAMQDIQSGNVVVYENDEDFLDSL